MNFDPSSPRSYEYIHFTKEAAETIDLTRTYTQTVEKLAFHTPNGLWLSVTGIDDWEQYCLKNSYRLENLKTEFQVMLKPTAKLLILYDNSAFEDFEEEYGYYAEGIEIHGDNYTHNLSISWERIISDYQGIVVPIVFPKFYNMSLWYDIWRCTSGCIWDLEAVEKAERLA